MPDPQRILIVRPSALGDVCRSVPVLVSLRKAYPNARIEWLVQDGFVDAIKAHPALDEVIPFPRNFFGSWWRNPIVAFAMIRWFIALRKRRYDLAIDFQALGRSGLITAATGAKRRVGYQSAREMGWIGYTIKHPDSTAIHTVERMLHLIESEGLEVVKDMQLYVSGADKRWWASRAEELGMLDKTYVVMAPTSRWASKRWPAERWAELLEPLLDRCFERIVMIGAPNECRQVQEIVPSSTFCEERFIDLVGKASIGQTMAVIDKASLVIANDSAPLHMAVGFNKPCIALFGPTSPARVGPYQRLDSVLRDKALEPQVAINFKDPRLGDTLMRSIKTEDVLERIDAFFADGRIVDGSHRGSVNAAHDLSAKVKEIAI